MKCRKLSGSSPISISLLVFALTGYAAENSNSETGIRIRIENNNAVAIRDLSVRFPRQQEEFGDLAAYQISDYRQVGLAYRYASIQFFVGDQWYSALAIDYVGETPLEQGSYTYSLKITNPGSFDIELISEAEN